MIADELLLIRYNEGGRTATRTTSSSVVTFLKAAAEAFETQEAERVVAAATAEAGRDEATKPAGEAPSLLAGFGCTGDVISRRTW